MNPTPDKPAMHLLRSVLPGLAVLVLLGGLYTYHEETTRLSEVARGLKGDAEARALRQRLIGQQLDVSSLTILRDERRVEEEFTGNVRALWFVNPSTCVDCLRDLSGWRALTRREMLDGQLVLTGISRSEAVKVGSTVNVTGNVLWDPDATQIRRITGDEIPHYLLLLLSRDRRIVAAELGDRRTSCDPDLFRNLARLVELVADQEGLRENASRSLASEGTGPTLTPIREKEDARSRQ